MTPYYIFWVSWELKPVKCLRTDKIRLRKPMSSMGAIRRFGFYILNIRQRFRYAFTDAQADLNLRWSTVCCCRFCCARFFNEMISLIFYSLIMSNDFYFIWTGYRTKRIPNRYKTDIWIISASDYCLASHAQTGNRPRISSTFLKVSYDVSICNLEISSIIDWSLNAKAKTHTLSLSRVKPHEFRTRLEFP